MSLVLGILGVALCWIPVVGLGCALLGFIFGWHAWRAAGRGSARRGHSSALAGWILGVIGGPIGIVCTAIVLTVLGNQLFSGIHG
jgi:hypothetical protein